MDLHAKSKQIYSLKHHYKYEQNTFNNYYKKNHDIFLIVKIQKIGIKI